MPPSTVKLIWSVSACNFCPRTGVRTCQIKPGKLLSKLSMALEMDVSALDDSEGICTCCLADIDMIIRAVAIRGAMKDYYMDFIQSSRRYNGDMEGNSYSNGHFMDSNHMLQNSMIDYESGGVSEQLQLHPPPPLLVARPQPSRESVPLPQAPPLPAHQAIKTQPSPESISDSPSTPTQNKKAKERHTRYQCVLCEKIAGSKSHCMEHLICHSPVRPFTCSHCLKTYKSRKACREHLIVMHGVEKVEENLQKLVLVDTEGLKQLEHVCTQYRKIFSPTMKSNEDLTILGTTVRLPAPKSEPEDHKADQDGGSAWLYSTTDQDTSRPPPLLQCGPANAMSSNVGNPTAYEDITPPPSKRPRKGTPHKLVHGIPELLDLQKIESAQEDSDDGSEREPTGLKLKQTHEWFPPVLPQDQSFYTSPVTPRNSPFFPSFTTAESVLPTMALPPNRQSPPSHNKKVVPPCERCGRCFPTKEKMADHMRSHSEVKQFSCLVCNRFFKYRRGVTNHLKEVHHFTDRNEISSKVASHEIGVVVQSKAARARERRAHGSRPTSKSKHEEQQHTDADNINISQKVIQDTLSSLADIQSAAESATMPAMESDDESKENKERADRSGSTDMDGDLVDRANSQSKAPSAVDSAESEGSYHTPLYDHSGADEVFNPEEDEDDMESINLELPKEPGIPLTAA